MEDEFLSDIRQWLLEWRVDQVAQPEEAAIPLPRTPLD